MKGARVMLDSNPSGFVYEDAENWTIEGGMLILVDSGDETVAVFPVRTLIGVDWVSDEN